MYVYLTSNVHEAYEAGDYLIVVCWIGSPIYLMVAQESRRMLSLINAKRNIE